MEQIYIVDENDLMLKKERKLFIYNYNNEPGAHDS